MTDRWLVPYTKDLVAACSSQIVDPISLDSLVGKEVTRRNPSIPGQRDGKVVIIG